MFKRLCAETRHCHLKGALFEKEKMRRDGIKMYKRKEAGCCRCQDPIYMNGKGLNCRGWGSYPLPALFWGELKESCDAHDCPSFSRQGSVANEGLWVSTRHFTLSASLTTPPHSPCTPTSQKKLLLLLPEIPSRIGLIGLTGNFGLSLVS